MADAALTLVSDLTTQIIELETRLASHAPLMDDEEYIHRQLDDLNEIDKHLQSIEKSIKELLKHSKQLDNDRLIRISEQLASRWQQMNSEINQRYFIRNILHVGFSRFVMLRIENDRSLNASKHANHLKLCISKKNK